MPKPPERFQKLAHQFDLVADMINECVDPKQRMLLLCHMKIILNEIDELISSNLNRDSQVNISSPPPNQPTAES